MAGALPMGRRVFVVVVSSWLLAAGATRAEDSAAAIERAVRQNKKAVEAYESLDFDGARRLFEETISYCAANGLDKHPIMARTHTNLGTVFVAIKQRRRGINEFLKALGIQPDIKLMKIIASPKIQKAFDEAVAMKLAERNAKARGDEEETNE